MFILPKNCTTFHSNVKCLLVLQQVLRLIQVVYVTSCHCFVSTRFYRQHWEFSGDTSMKSQYGSFGAVCNLECTLWIHRYARGVVEALKSLYQMTLCVSFWLAHDSLLRLISHINSVVIVHLDSAFLMIVCGHHSPIGLDLIVSAEAHHAICVRNLNLFSFDLY